MKHEELTHKIIGAAMEVHRTLGCGFLEAVYQEALELQLRARGILFVPQPETEISYKGTALNYLKATGRNAALLIDFGAALVF